MTSAKPILTVIAGSNGSGKSTFTRYTQETLGVPVIDPDLEARKLDQTRLKQQLLLVVNKLYYALVLI